MKAIWQPRKNFQYSWVLPVKNEAQSLPQLISEINQVMRGKNLPAGRQDFEIVVVNDASEDNTARVLQKTAKITPQLKIITLKKHHGKWATLAKGFNLAKGQTIIALDSDLQDDPSQLPKLLAKFNQGYDLVSGWRKIRYDPFYKVFISKLGNQMVSLATGRKFHDLNSAFKIYKRDVLENLPKQGSMLRFTMLFAYKLGYRVAEVPVAHRPRLFGRSKFGLVKYLRIIYDLILILLLFTGSGRVTRR